MTDFKKIVEQNKDLIIKHTTELIQIPSVLDETTATDLAPFGAKIQEALDYMINLAKEDGFETAVDGGYAGHVAYGNPDGKIVGVLYLLSEEKLTEIANGLNIYNFSNSIIVPP